MDLASLNVRITASDEASRVIERVKSSAKGVNGQQTWKKGDPIPKNWYAKTGEAPEGQGGAMAQKGMGMVNAASGVFLLGQIAKFGKMSLDKLTEASPLLASQLKMLDIAVNRFLRPLGDSIAKAMMPTTMEALKKAQTQADLLKKIDDQFGPIGTAAATVGMAIVEIQNGILNLFYVLSPLKPMIEALTKLFGLLLGNGSGTGTQGSIQSFAPAGNAQTPQSYAPTAQANTSTSAQSYAPTNVQITLGSTLSQIATVESVRYG